MVSPYEGGAIHNQRVEVGTLASWSIASPEDDPCNVSESGSVQNHPGRLQQ